MIKLYLNIKIVLNNKNKKDHMLSLRNVCMAVWVYGCVCVWVYVCMGIWVYGCMAVWVYGCVGIWVLVLEYVCIHTYALLGVGTYDN